MLGMLVGSGITHNSCNDDNYTKYFTGQTSCPPDHTDVSCSAWSCSPGISYNRGHVQLYCVVQWLEFLLFIFLEFPFNLLENYDKGLARAGI